MSEILKEEIERFFKEKSICILKEENKRLQAENKELKHKNEILLGQLVINDGEDVTVQISQSQFDEYNELKVENEELKKEINLYKNSIVANHDRAIGKRFEEVLEENERLKDDKNRYELYIKEERDNNYNYRKALEEIREISKDNYYSCTDCDKQRKELNCNEKCNAYRLREIKDKISEVLDER